MKCNEGCWCIFNTINLCHLSAMLYTKLQRAPHIMTLCPSILPATLTACTFPMCAGETAAFYVPMSWIEDTTVVLVYCIVTVFLNIPCGVRG